MQQQTEVQTLVDRGNDLLKNGRVTEAAATFAQAVQVDQQATAPHLGLAEASLALNDVGMVYAACRQAIQLDPNGADAAVAQALLAVVEGRYDAALAAVDHAIQLDPGRPYVHALRGYCLRQLGQRYEGALAEARAARGWGTRDFTHLFPKQGATAASIEAQRPPQHAVQQAPGQAPQQASPQDIAPGMPQRISYDQQRQWRTQSPIQRRMIRARFMFRGIPIMTLCLLVTNIAVYLICAIVSGNLFSPFPANAQTLAQTGPIYSFGSELGTLIQQNPLQSYRLVTAMFLHFNIEHIALNMLSLYFVGVVTEQIFGPWRFLLIYFAAGIAGGLAMALLSPTEVSIGASGAIFGIFGAFGAFVLLRRQAFGRAANAVIGQWVFWLALNIWFTFSVPNIAIWDHVFGVLAGFALGALIVSTARRRRAFS